MITAAVIGFLLGLFARVMSLVPLPSVPSWLSDDGSIAKVFAGAQHLGAWFPVHIVTTVLLAVLAINVVGFAVRICRIVLSLATGGGGGAG